MAARSPRSGHPPAHQTRILDVQMFSNLFRIAAKNDPAAVTAGGEATAGVRRRGLFRGIRTDAAAIKRTVETGYGATVAPAFAVSREVAGPCGACVIASGGRLQSGTLVCSASACRAQRMG